MIEISPAFPTIQMKTLDYTLNGQLTGKHWDGIVQPLR